MAETWWGLCVRLTSMVCCFLYTVTVSANVVLEDTVERIFVGNKYCEKSLGIFIIRGENVVMLSEIVR